MWVVSCLHLTLLYSSTTTISSSHPTFLSPLSAQDEDTRYKVYSPSYLKHSFKWEFRIVYLGVLGLFLFAIDERDVAFWIFGACAFAILIVDAFVSMLLVAIFLRPILDTLNMAGGIVRTEAEKNLQKTKWMTMGIHVHIIYEHRSLYMQQHIHICVCIYIICIYMHACMFMCMYICGCTYI